MHAYCRYARIGELRLGYLREVLAAVEDDCAPQDLTELLRTSAEYKTVDMEGEIAPLLPWQGERHLIIDEPRPYLPLEAWLVIMDSIEAVSPYTDEVETEVVLDYLRHEIGKSYVHGNKRYIFQGHYDVTGLWGLFDKTVREGATVGLNVTTSGVTAVDARSLVLTEDFNAGGAEVFWDATRLQHLVATGNSTSSTLVLDQWGTPEVEIPAATELVFCGRLHPLVERLVLVASYLEALRRAGSGGDPGGIVSERADRHAIKRSEFASNDPSSNYTTELRNLRLKLGGVLSPWRYS